MCDYEMKNLCLTVGTCICTCTMVTETPILITTGTDAEHHMVLL